MSDAQSTASAAQTVDSAPATAPEQAPNTENTSAAGDYDGDDAALLAEATALSNGRLAARKAAKEAEPAEKPAEAAPAKTDAKEEKTPAPKASEWAKLHEQKKAQFAKEQDLKSREEKLSAFEKTARTDKLAALALLGYDTPEKQVQFIKDIAESNGQVSPEREKMTTLEREIQALREEREKERAEAQTKAQQAEEAAAIDRLNSDVVQFLKTDPKFSKGLVSIDGGQQAIVAMMQEHYARTEAESGEGQVLSFADAAAKVEKEWEAGLLKFANHPRGRELLQQALLKSQSPKATSSKPVAKAAAPAPRQQQADPEADGEKLLAEAMQMMRRNAQARREA